MPPPPPRCSPLFPDVEAGPEEASALLALPACPAVNLSHFTALMDEVLLLRRGPRSYLVPSPSSKYSPNHSFKPAINKKSKDMAAKLRPVDVSLYEILHATAEVNRSKLEARRKEQADNSMKDCTFHPKLNANTRAVEGRALRGSGVAARPEGGAAAAGYAGSPRLRSSPTVTLGLAPDAESKEMLQFMAMEKEVQEMLAVTSLASEHLAALSDLPLQPPGSSPNPAAAASPLPPRGPPSCGSTPETRGDRVDPEDLRATEELLLDLLNGGDPTDPATDATVLPLLHKFLAESGSDYILQQQLAPSPRGGAGVAAAAGSVFVVQASHSPAGSSTRSTPMQELASTLMTP